MEVTFPSELQHFIDACVAEGFYRDGEDVVRDAVRHLFAEMSVDGADLPTSLPALDVSDEDEALLVSLRSAVRGLDEADEPPAGEPSGDALLDLLGATRGRLLRVLEAVEQDILANTTTGTSAERLDVSTGIGTASRYVTLRIPRGDIPGEWRSQPIAAPRGPLTLEDLEFARADLLQAISELNQRQSLRLQMYLERYSQTVQTLSSLLRAVSDSDAAIIAKLR